MTDPARLMTAQSMSPHAKRMALWTLVVALVLEIVDLTIVNTALPAIQQGIGADATHARWIVAGYSLSFALLLMAGGRLGDSFGYRRMFVWGVGGFTLASLGCGLARTGDELVAARLLQGATGALMAPQSMALLQVLFDPLERVSKLAMFGVIGGLAAIAGPILGGMLIEADVLGLGWRLIFIINLPVGLLAIVAALRYLPATRSSHGAPGHDVWGTVLFGAAVGAFLWPLMQSEAGGMTALALLPLLAVVPLGWLGWRHVAARTASGGAALFDPAILSIPTFRLGLGISVAFAAASAGFLLVFAFGLQTERGETSLVTALLHMPYGFGAMFGIGVLSRKLLPRFGKLIPLCGSLVMAISTTLVLLAIGQDWSLMTVAPAMILAGVGMGMTTGCIGAITFAQMDRGHAGAASGLLKTCQQLGSAIGVAIAGSAYFVWARQFGTAPSPFSAGIIAALLLVCAWAASRLPTSIFAKPDEDFEFPITPHRGLARQIELQNP